MSSVSAANTANKTVTKPASRLNAKLWFGSLIAVILLGLYVYAVVTAIFIVNCNATGGCAEPEKLFTIGFANVMTIVGSLVSALVIAELAATKPGETPGARMLPGTPSVTTSSTDGSTSDEPGPLNKAVIILYFVVWLFTGLAAFVVGWMQYPGVIQPLTDLGQAWLGLAVAAAYAYFGIDPKRGDKSDQ